MVVNLLSSYLTKSNYFGVGGAFCSKMVVAKSKLRFDCYNKDVCISRRVLSTLRTESPLIFLAKSGRGRNLCRHSRQIHIEHAPNSSFSATSIKPLP